jgi:hypothetical protein
MIQPTSSNIMEIKAALQQGLPLLSESLFETFSVDQSKTSEKLYQNISLHRNFLLIQRHLKAALALES